MNIKAFDNALDFVPAKDDSAAKAGVFATIVSAYEAISEGIQLAGDYKTLTSRGVPPDVAVRLVFDKIKR